MDSLNNKHRSAENNEKRFRSHVHQQEKGKGQKRTRKEKNPIVKKFENLAWKKLNFDYFKLLRTKSNH